MSLKMYGKYNNKEERDNDKPARQKMAMAKKMTGGKKEKGLYKVLEGKSVEDRIKFMRNK